MPMVIHLRTKGLLSFKHFHIAAPRSWFNNRYCKTSDLCSSHLPPFVRLDRHPLRRRKQKESWRGNKKIRPWQTLWAELHPSHPSSYALGRGAIQRLDRLQDLRMERTASQTQVQEFSKGLHGDRYENEGYISWDWSRQHTNISIWLHERAASVFLMPPRKL